MSAKYNLWEIPSSLQPSQEQLTQFVSSYNSLSLEQIQTISKRDLTIALQWQSNLFVTEPLPPPQKWSILLDRCDKLVGKTIATIADKLQLTVPDNLKNNRGWIGNLLELALGAEAGSKPIQDFVNLGIELKSVAINHKGEVNNDIFVSSLPINSFMLQTWHTSHLLYKLKRILFVPIEQIKEIPLANRRIGRARLWTPTAYELSQLQQDWQDILDIITEGDFNAIKNNVGKILCVKVKALNAKQSNSFIDTEGFTSKIPPLSFYLRKDFVNSIFYPFDN